MAGKGDKRRPRAAHVTREAYESNWDVAFQKPTENSTTADAGRKSGPKHDRRHTCPK